LIYYRIKKGDGNWYTNLYGVLFLEEVTTSDYNIDLNNEDDDRAGYIQRYPKFKDGNSWGLKLDLKIDAQPDSQMVLRDKEYDDPNGGGVGMQMFTEALMKLNDCAKLFYDVKKENTDIEERLYSLENIMSGVDNVYELTTEVNLLRSRLEMLQPSIESLKGRMDDAENKISNLETNLGYLIRRMTEQETNVNTLIENMGKYQLIIGDID
jgi:flagellin-like hook-associated protein FlgL